MRDDQRPEYPLPCDPVTGMGWWRFNLLLCGFLPGYSLWQKNKRMDEIIPTLRWLIHGAIA